MCNEICCLALLVHVELYAYLTWIMPNKSIGTGLQKDQNDQIAGYLKVWDQLR